MYRTFLANEVSLLGLPQMRKFFVFTMRFYEFTNQFLRMIEINVIQEEKDKST